MINPRHVRFSVLGVIALAFAFPGAAVRAADGATNAPSQAVPSDSPPAPTIPSEAPQPGSPASTGSPTTAAPAPDTGERPTEYTVASGDTLWALSHKFDTSIRALKKLNHLKKNNLKPGQVLKIPAARSTEAPAKKTTEVPPRADSVALEEAAPASRKAQPAQNFDLSTPAFASCPVPPSPVRVDETKPLELKPLKVAMASSPSVASSWKGEPSYLTPSGPMELPAPATSLVSKARPAQAKSASATRSSTKMLARTSATAVTPAITYSSPAPASTPALTPKPAVHGLFNFFYTPPPSPTVDWGARFTQAARQLGDQGINYSEDWRPPGEAHSWTMDCSNTARYLYKATTGIQLPRTASDQYYYLHLQKKAWDVPMTLRGYADCNYLRQNLQPGDLLFWENTYRPDRQPPITHVMVYLGTNARGEWTMAGSQTTRGGEHNRRHGGPDIYVFNPTRPCGGYTTWLGLVHHKGRFCAYGRPLEADKSKLSVAADN